MARRTKEEALATRQQLLAAAEQVFATKGVSRTSLQDIAQAAGTTRGAIYWHFDNKADLFNAMMEQAVLPMEQALQQIGHDARQDPLLELERAMLQAMGSIAEDTRTRRIFEIATSKVEYVDEMLAVKARHAQSCMNAAGETERSLREAAARRGVQLPISPVVAAQGLQALMMGLIHTWILSPQVFDLVETTRAALRTYLAGLGLQIGVDPP